MAGFSNASGSGSFDVAHAVDIQTDGKILVAGYSTANGDNDFALARYKDSTVIEVDIGIEPNSIQCENDKKVIKVTIFSTEDFDATTVNHATVMFEGATC